FKIQYFLLLFEMNKKTKTIYNLKHKGIFCSIFHVMLPFIQISKLICVSNCCDFKSYTHTVVRCATLLKYIVGFIKYFGFQKLMNF
ncbi:hypothetical protein ACJX0J_026844, partial [Zea mays]